MERSIHIMKKFRTALAVSMLILMSVFVLSGCGTDRNKDDMADNQTENNNATADSDTTDETTANGTDNGGGLVDNGNTEGTNGNTADNGTINGSSTNNTNGSR